MILFENTVRVLSVFNIIVIIIIIIVFCHLNLCNIPTCITNQYVCSIYVYNLFYFLKESFKYLLVLIYIYLCYYIHLLILKNENKFYLVQVVKVPENS